MIKTVYWFSCKVLFVLVRYEWNLNFLYGFSKKYSNIKFHENPSIESWVVPWGQIFRGTDRHDEANGRFSQFCERALKGKLLLGFHSSNGYLIEPQCYVVCALSFYKVMNFRIYLLETQVLHVYLIIYVPRRRQTSCVCVSVCVCVCVCVRIYVCMSVCPSYSSSIQEGHETLWAHHAIRNCSI
jgi:hypothetical protein